MKPWVQRKLSLSLNNALVNKNESGRADAYTKFRSADLGIEDLAAEIKAGHAFCAAMTGMRSNANFAGADFACVDVDDGVSLADALTLPLVKEAGTLIYTTCSHTEDHNRFRIVFVLERTMKRSGDFSKLLKVLAKQVGGDFKATDAARICYGNSAAAITWLNNGLSYNAVQDLLKQYDPDTEAGAPPHATTTRSTYRLSKSHLIKPGQGEPRPLDTFKVGSAVCCPFHDDKSPSAVVRERKQVKYLQCFACAESFWPDDTAGQFNFDAFDHAADNAVAAGDMQLKLNDVVWPLATLAVVEQKYLSLRELKPGVTFIKSPKGSGKTEYVKHVVQTEPGDKRVLLVGHRVSLVRAMCERLELKCYLENKNVRPLRVSQDRYGTSLDSLYKIPSSLKYDLVILDECEQVLSHFFSETMKEKRIGNYNRLQRALIDAEKVVVLDADISPLSFETVVALAETESHKDRHVIINRFLQGQDRSISFFQSKNHLAKDLVEAVEAGRRCYVVSNGKTIVDDLAELLKPKLNGNRLLLITSDTSDTTEGSAFIKDPVNKALEYQVVLSSPSLSSGVDLSFPDGAKFYDDVYGFFFPNINNHFDCDQQLARVRNPGNVKVFVSPAIANLESDFEVVKRDLMESTLFAHLSDHRGIDENKAHSDGFLRLLAMVQARNRASSNALLKNYQSYLRGGGYSLLHVKTDLEGQVDGGVLLKEAALSAKDKRIKNLMEVVRLPRWKLSSITTKMRHGHPVTNEEKYQLERSKIEAFYRRRVFPQLIEAHYQLKLDQKIKMYEAVHGEAVLGNDGSTPMVPTSTIVGSDIQKARFLKLAFVKAGVVDENGFKDDCVFDQSSLEAFRSFMSSNKAVYEALFCKKLRSDLIKSSAIQLTDLLSLCHVKTIDKDRVAAGNLRVKRYTLNPIQLSALEKLRHIRETTLSDWPEYDRF